MKVLKMILLKNWQKKGTNNIMKITNRKLLTFFISLGAVIVLSIFGKDPTAVIGLFSVYCVGNVSAKFATNKKEQV